MWKSLFIVVGVILLLGLCPSAWAQPANPAGMFYVMAGGSTLSTSSTNYFEFGPDAASAGSESSTQRFVVMKGLRIWAMRCAVNTAPSAGTRTFTLREAGGATAFTCTIATGATTCVYQYRGSPLNPTIGDKMDVETSRTSSTAMSGSCLFTVSIDDF